MAKRKNPPKNEPIGHVPGPRHPVGGHKNPFPGRCPHGHVRLYSDDPSHSLGVQAPMGPNPPDVIDGFGGGYTVTPRKRRRSLTDFDTLNPIRIQIEMMFDRFAQRESVEKEIRTLEKMGAIPDESSEPPHLIYDAGGSGPHDKKRAKHNRWVISEPIVWSQQKWHPKRRFRTRIMATVVLQQVVQDKHLKLRKKAKKKKPGFDKNDKCKERKDPRKKFYTVKKGDTLAKIAARFYGDSDCWKKIARANDIRDPKKVKVGKKIKLP